MGRRVYRVVFAVLFCSLPCAHVQAQHAQTGTITGRVSADGIGLAGVTVSFESPAMQGSRLVVTQTNGDYISPFLPPGLYSVSFAMAGFKTLVAEVKVSAQQVRRLDTQMVDERFEGEIEVAAARETISRQTQAQTTVPLELFNTLPLPHGDNLYQSALLAPGVLATGPSDRISISGAQSFENLWITNGIDTEGLDVYIEDAVLETTTSVSAISAEYGRFQGGVVNMLTKSGGNRFSGSLRAYLTNDAWVARTPLSPEREDEISTRYEATFGGYVLRDRLWFFLSGRSLESTSGETTGCTLIPYSFSDDRKRFEGKLTWSLTSNHRFVGTYFKRQDTANNTSFGTILDLASLNQESQNKYEMYSVNYTGVLGPRFYIEGLFANIDGTGRIGYGSPYTDVVRGTLLLDRSRGDARYHTATFCSAPECRHSELGNENLYLKLSWFAASEDLGTHDLVLGFEQYSWHSALDNHQQGSDFRIYGSAAIILDDGSIYPVFAPDGRFGNRQTYYRWTPIFLPANESDFTTDSIYANDTWRLNNHWSFNIGVRYDKNDSVDGSGSKVADDSRITPRLGATWDIRGDGMWQINAGYAQYVGRINSGIANYPSGAGQPAWTGGWYTGPCINCEAYQSGDDSNLVSQDEAIAIWYDWFLANGGTEDPPNFFGGAFPGFTPQIPESLVSPITTEWTLGMTRRLGSRGLLRVDLVDREGSDFYVLENQAGRTVTTDFGTTLDLAYLTNDPGFYRRTYRGLHANFQYRIGDRWQIGAAWTYSEAKGNFDGESWNSGADEGTFLEYAEYREASWNCPIGWLAVDQRNQLRSWAVWDAISTRRHNLSLSVMFNYWSGENYSDVAPVSVGPYVANPGYETPPSTMTYFFGERGGEHWDNISSTDLAINYGFTVIRGLQLFVQFDVFNLFNRQGQIGGDTTINIIQPFNPFEEEPIQGVHWDYGSNYREPIDEASFQRPREYQVSLGIRF